MAGLQRSGVSFRRQGSSGLVWDDRFLSGELTRQSNNHHDRPERRFFSGELSRPNRQHHREIIHDLENEKGTTAGIKIKAIRTTRSDGEQSSRRNSMASEPPSPKLSTCGCCGKFGRSPAGRRKPSSR